jgi:hypothetical protein
MPDEHMFSDSCQVLEQRLTAAERQAIRDHARAAADAMGAAAAAIMERWPKLAGVDEVALQRAVADAWRIRAMADALEQLERRHG